MDKKKRLWFPDTQSYWALPKEDVKAMKDRLKELVEENKKRKENNQSYTDTKGKSIIQYEENLVNECYERVAKILSEYDNAVANSVIDTLTIQKNDYIKNKFMRGQNVE